MSTADLRGLFVWKLFVFQIVELKSKIGELDNVHYSKVWKLFVSFGHLN